MSNFNDEMMKSFTEEKRDLDNEIIYIEKFIEDEAEWLEKLEDEEDKLIHTTRFNQLTEYLSNLKILSIKPIKTDYDVSMYFLKSHRDMYFRDGNSGLFELVGKDKTHEDIIDALCYGFEFISTIGINPNTTHYKDVSIYN